MIRKTYKTRSMDLMSGYRAKIGRKANNSIFKIKDGDGL